MQRQNREKIMLGFLTEVFKKAGDVYKAFGIECPIRVELLASEIDLKPTQNLVVHNLYDNSEN